MTTMTELTMSDGSIIVPLSAQQRKQAVSKASKFPATRPFIVPAKGTEGVGAYGVYMELVLTHSNDDPTSAPFRHTRYFVYGSNVYAASRVFDQSKANWKRRETKGVAHSLNILRDALVRPNAHLYGRVTLVEMRADDLSAIESGQIPGARFRGQYRVETDFGKYQWGDKIFSNEMPTSLKEWLTASAA